MDNTKPFVILYKPLGSTPLSTVEQFRLDNPHYSNVKLSYAGRLDPMAEGLLFVLIGDANKERRTYEKLDKTYECSFLFGISTDSYDGMGLITNDTTPPSLSELKQHIAKTLPLFLGKIVQDLPPYSSYRVNGRPLFAWARENRLGTITMPQTTVTIHNMTLDGIRMEKTQQFAESFIRTIQTVKGEFRQNEIIDGWTKFLHKSIITEYPVASFTVSCSSGTYIRALTKRFEQLLHIPCMVRYIKRTTIGAYSFSDVAVT